MQPERHETVYAEQGQYVAPSTQIPDEYWLQSAQTKVDLNTGGTSTVACWVLIVVGLIIPIFALGAGGWAAWMAREDSKFAIPAAVGLGIFAYAFFL
jgi:hypothetical protein